MPPLLKEHNHYGVYEKAQADSSESDDDDDIHSKVPASAVRAADPNSRLSEIGFLVGTACVVAGFIWLWLHLLMKEPLSKFDDESGSRRYR